MLRNRKNQTSSTTGSMGPEPDSDQRKILSGLTEVAKQRTSAEQAFEVFKSLKLILSNFMVTGFVS